MGKAHFAGAGVKIFEQSCPFDFFGLGVAAMADELIYRWHNEMIL